MPYGVKRSSAIPARFVVTSAGAGSGQPRDSVSGTRELVERTGVTYTIGRDPSGLDAVLGEALGGQEELRNEGPRPCQCCVIE